MRLPGGNWAVTLDFRRPGKPTDKAFREPSNGQLGDEYLNVLVAGRREEQDRGVAAALQ